MDKVKSYFLNLFAIALADTDIDPTEVKLLYDIGIEKGFTKEEIDKILSEPHNVTFYMPQSNIEKFDQLYDLARMVWADRVIKDEEIQTLKNLATRFGIKKEFLKNLIDSLLEGVKNNIDKSSIFQSILNYL